MWRTIYYGTILEQSWSGSGSEGGGDGAPEWVPADAKIHIDLVNDRAWTEADGEVSIDTLLGTDANTENYWGPSSYDAGDLTVDGLVYSTSPPALIGSALARMIAGSTTRIQYKIVDTNSDDYVLKIMSADGNSAISCAFGSAASATSDLVGSTFSISGVGSSSRTAGEVNAVAMTLTPASSTGRGDIAFNGSEAGSDEIQLVDWPDDTYVAALIDMGSHVALQSITIYDALPSTAGLSALSEIG